MRQFQLISLVSLLLAATLLLVGCSKSPDQVPGSSQTEPPSVSQPVTPEGGSSAEVPDAAAGEAARLMALLGKSDADVTAALGQGSATTDEAGTVTVREYEMEVLGLQTLTTVSYGETGANMVIAYAAENQFDAWVQALTDELGAPTSERADSTEGGDSKEQTWVVNGAMVTVRSAYDTLSLEIFPEA